MKLRRIIFPALGASILLLIGLWLDLTNEGLVWDTLWNVTGESEPAGQLLGAAQYAATFTRVPPDTKTEVEIQHIPDNPFGVNTFLQQEVLPENRQRQLDMIQAAGIGWIRQEFPWEDIEIHARGDFNDRRNDLDGDGQVDEISAWDKYDNIVDLVDAAPDVQMIVRLSNPPSWSQPEVTTAHGPPADLKDYVNYAVAVAERYQGRIHYYQIWNEPNLYPEWGEQSVNPEAYAEMLCRTHDALKAVDPNIVVLSAAIGPTMDLSGRDAYDLLYLQRLYDYGISDCFDILSAQAYGLFSGPTDRRRRATLTNFARHVWYRDIMVNNGDAHKPIWISEAGWNPVPSLAEVPDLSGRETFGVVTMQQAADYVPEAYQRMLSEWDWVGTMSYWFFKRADDSERNQSWYYFRLVNPDFSPTPIYDSFVQTTQNMDWQTWRTDPNANWEHRARECIPQVLVLTTGVLVFGFFFLRSLFGYR